MIVPNALLCSHEEYATTSPLRLRLATARNEQGITVLFIGNVLWERYDVAQASD